MIVQPIEWNERETALAQLKKLLAENGLCFEDLTIEHLKYFGVLRNTASLMGAVGLEPCGDAGLLRSLVVMAGCRGTGLGQLLTNWVEALARSCGVRELYLLTTTAEGFFNKLGYWRVERSNVPIAVQETSEFQSLCPETAVCMLKSLA